MSIPRIADGIDAETCYVPRWKQYPRMANPFGSRLPKSKTEISFANNLFIVALGWAIFTVVVIADVYAMVQLGRGEA